MECPRGHGRQNIIVNITADGMPPKQANEIIARRLECGCVVGGEQYEKFKAAMADIEKDRVLGVQNLEEEARLAKEAVYQTYILKGGEEHAE